MFETLAKEFPKVAKHLKTVKPVKLSKFVTDYHMQAQKFTDKQGNEANLFGMEPDLEGKFDIKETLDEFYNKFLTDTGQKSRVTQVLSGAKSEKEFLSRRLDDFALSKTGIHMSRDIMQSFDTDNYLDRLLNSRVLNIIAVNQDNKLGLLIYTNNQPVLSDTEVTDAWNNFIDANRDYFTNDLINLILHDEKVYQKSKKMLEELSIRYPSLLKVLDTIDKIDYLTRSLVGSPVGGY